MHTFEMKKLSFLNEIDLIFYDYENYKLKSFINEK